MRKLIGVIALCVLTFPALWETASKYQVGFITEVEPRQSTETVRLIPPAMTFLQSRRHNLRGTVHATVRGKLAAKYATGHELLKSEKNTITYNDMLGQSLQVPIESQNR